MLEKFATELG